MACPLWIFLCFSIKIMPESAIKFFSYESSVRHFVFPLPRPLSSTDEFSLLPVILQKRFLARYWDKVDDPSLISGSSRFLSGGIGGLTSQFAIYPVSSSFRFVSLLSLFRSLFVFGPCPLSMSILTLVAFARPRRSPAGNAQDATHDDGRIESQLEDPSQERCRHVADWRYPAVLSRTDGVYLRGVLVLLSSSETREARRGR